VPTLRPGDQPGDVRDGQMLFLANMASKMNAKSALGSRIAEV